MQVDHVLHAWICGHAHDLKVSLAESSHGELVYLTRWLLLKHPDQVQWCSSV